MSNNYSVEISMLINNVFFLKTPKNKDWWKKDYSKDVMLFLNLTWISASCILFLEEYASWFIVLGVVILFVICLVGLLISFATWTEAKQIQLLYEGNDSFITPYAVGGD